MIHPPLAGSGATRMVKEITFDPMLNSTGIFTRPDPPILDLAGIIFVQRGEALVGAWDAERGGFVHPYNQRELSADALAAVREAYPDAEAASVNLRVYICPQSLVGRFDWGLASGGIDA